MADILTSNAPAPNATSDMPQVVPPAPADAGPIVTTSIDVPSATAPATTPLPTTAPEESEPIKARFATLAAQRREAESRAARLESMVTQQQDQIREALAAIQKLATPPIVTPPPVSETSFSEPRPAREAYTDSDTYETALVSWASQKAAFEASSAMREQQEKLDAERRERSEREQREVAEAVQKRQQEEVQAQILSAWNERRAKTAEKYEDYTEVAENPAISVSIAMAHTLMNSEDGAEILYYLGKHPEEASRIAAMIVPGQTFPANMGPLSGAPVPDGPKQAYELGKIATKLGLEIAPATSPATDLDTITPPANALAPNGVATPATPVTVTAPPAITVLPAPPQPISGVSSAAVANSSDLKVPKTMEEYAAIRTPQIQAERFPSRR